MSHTKLIATVGPASIDLLQELQDAGVSVFRLNFSHGEKPWHKEQIQKLRNLKNPTKIMLDTKGPEIRTGVMEHPVELKEGERVILVTNKDAQNIKNRLIYCDYSELPKSVSEGSIIQFANGVFSGKVKSIHQSSVIVEMESGGTLGSRKHVNLPGARINLPTISKNDEVDILFGKENKVDMVALSFARNVQDIKKARELVGEGIEIIAKIECEPSVKNFHSIAKAADAIMIARGDLGVEMELEHLPVLQKKMLKDMQNIENTYSIVATGLLKSMVDEPRPRRAEVSDIATAVWEDADYVMVSDETTVGKNPVEVINVMRRVVEYAEKYKG